MKLLFMLIMAYVHQPKEAKMKLPNQFRNLKVTIVALLVAALTSCSPGGGGSAATALTPPASAVPPATDVPPAPLVTPAPWVSYSVATAADLPTCAGDIVSRLYYVEATNSFSVCKTTGWATLPIGSRFVAGFFCYDIVSGVTGPAGTALNGVLVEYRAVLTAAGDVMSTAEITPQGGLFQVSGTSFWAASQSASSTAPVNIIADMTTPNYGKWKISVNRSSLVTTVVYTDPTLGVQSPVTITFPASACNALRF